MSIYKPHLSEESIRVLRALRLSGGRLHGRFDRDDPFVHTDLGSPDRDSVPVSIAEELFEAGLIEIDESAPIGDTYTFQVSREGKEF